MGSKTFDGVYFQVYSRDHPPPHVHGFYSSTLAVVELADSANVGLRRGSVKPPNAKKSDVKRIVDAAVAITLNLCSCGSRSMARLAEDIDEQIDRAIAEARDFYDDEVATSVRYVQAEDMFVLVLRSGRRVLIAREDLQELADASPQQAADVSLGMLNTAVHWEKLDVDYPVKGLADGWRGNDAWMKRLAERQSPAYAA